MDDILQKIVAAKKKHLQRLKEKVLLEFLKEQILRLPASRQFVETLKTQILQNKIAIITEIKKSSPSKGLIAKDFSPAELAKIYEENGASCISVLTETDFFYGSDNDLKEAKQHCSIPILRKDFIIDTYQIYESAFIGADCILLIAAILSDAQLKEFYTLARRLHLDVLLEVHNHKELERALKLDPVLIGINNRNLKNFKVDLKVTIELAKEIPDEKLIVCESGINTRKDIELMLNNNIKAFLIGETLLKSTDRAKKLKQLLNG